MVTSRVDVFGGKRKEEKKVSPLWTLQNLDISDGLSPLPVVVMADDFDSLLFGGYEPPVAATGIGEKKGVPWPMGSVYIN